MTQRSWVKAVRQHHGIEHATLTLLNRRAPATHLFARSDSRGFVVYGDVATMDLRAAAEEAVARLKAGEAGLAVHPNCGTNLVTAGMLSGLAVLLATSDHRRSLWDRAPGAVLAAMTALMAAPALGRWTQANVTTSPQVEGLRVIDVIRCDSGPLVRHRVVIST
jgi:Domain of unknown function (DUF6391)